MPTQKYLCLKTEGVVCISLCLKTEGVVYVSMLEDRGCGVYVYA